MDPSSSIPLICLYLILMLCSSYFSATEMAFSSATKIKVLGFRDDYPKQVDLVLNIQENYNFYLITLLVGNNIVNTGLAAVSTIFAARIYHAMIAGGATVAESGVTAVATVVTTIAIFLFCETIPKTYAKDNCERMTVRVAPSLRVISYILYPISIIFMGLSKLLDKCVRAPEEPTVTEEELSTIIENSEEDGVLNEDQSELLQSALEFSDTRVADVLTLRDDVVWLDIDSTKQEILAKIKKTKFSRLPVCRGSLDHPVGILIVNDFLKVYITGKFVNLSYLLRKPFFTTLDASIDDLKGEMSGNRQHLALVRDREGQSVIGVVTIEDFLEELVGEIYDESDVVDDNFMKLGGNYFRVSGRLTLGDAFRRMDYNPQRSVPRHKPVSTWILEQLGRIPEEDDTFTWEDLSVTVDEIEQNRVCVATIKLADPMIDLPDETEERAAASEEGGDA